MVLHCLFLDCSLLSAPFSRWLVVICPPWMSCTTSEEKGREDTHVQALISSKIRDTIKRSLLPRRVELSSYSKSLPETPTLYIPFIISDLFLTIAYVHCPQYPLHLIHLSLTVTLHECVNINLLCRFQLLIHVQYAFWYNYIYSESQWHIHKVKGNCYVN